KDMVADKRARVLRYTCRKPVGAQLGNDGLDWKRRPIADGAAAHHSPTGRLTPGIVRDTGVVHVDGDAFRCDLGAILRQAEADHQRWLVLFEKRFQLAYGFAELAGQSRAHHAVVADRPAAKPPGDELRRIQGVATEGLKAGEQDGFHQKR